MTVDEVIGNFRDALRALVPFVERAGVGWRREDAYDEWDDIVSSVYEGVVQEPLRWALPEGERDRFELPPYDLVLERYTSPTMIEVSIGDEPTLRVFHSLRTDKAPFDVCECRVVSGDGTPVSKEMSSYPLTAVHFRLRHRAKDGHILVLDGVPA